MKINLQILQNESITSSYATASLPGDRTHGVKSIFIIANVPDIPENYLNLKYLWQAVGLDNLNSKFIVSSDTKMCNLLLGLMSNGSSHPCPWCDVHKSDLMNRGTSRTWNNLSTLFWSYYDSSETKSKAKNYGNAIHPAIIHGDGSERIL